MMTVDDTIGGGRFGGRGSITDGDETFESSGMSANKCVGRNFGERSDVARGEMGRKTLRFQVAKTEVGAGLVGLIGE